MTGEVVSGAAAASLQDARSAVAVAAEAFASRSSTTPGQRRSILLEAARLLEARPGEFESVAPEELGTSKGFVRLNLQLDAGILREAAVLTTQVTGEIIPANRPGTTGFPMRQPVGVILSLAPWNAPIIRTPGLGGAGQTRRRGGEDGQ